MKPRRLLSFCLATIFVTGCGIIGDPPALFHYQNCWSVAAATGIADETARDHLIFGFPPDPNVVLPEDQVPIPETLTLDGTITLDNRSSKGTYQIRYPLYQQFIFQRIVGEDDFADAVNLRARYRVIDPEESAVRVFLKSFPLENNTGLERSEILMQINSDDFSPSDQFQEQSVFNGNITFDFSRFAYYIDVQLIDKKDDPLESPLGQQSRSPSLASLVICLGGGPPVD